MKITSRTGKSEYPDYQIFKFISNFNNFRNLIPVDRISDWESTEEHCTFRIDPVGKTGMKIIEKEPNTLIKVSSIPDLSQYNFTIWIQLKRMNDNDTRIRVILEPHVNEFLLPMLKNPLQQFVDKLVEKIEQFNFNRPPGT